MMRRGFKSTEFWINLVGMLGGFLLASMGDSTWSQLVGGVLAAVCGGSYTIGRSMVKGNEALGAARVESAVAMAKKLKAS